MSEVFRGFTKSFQASAGIVPRLGHTLFLYIIYNMLFKNYPVIRRYILRDTGNVLQ
jgi:hypothetical protein